MKKLCATCELIKTGGIFTGGECKEHPYPKKSKDSKCSLRKEDKNG